MGDTPDNMAAADDGRIALLTRHGKERVLALVLEPALEGVLQRIDDFDTDTLGSFTREIPRVGTQIEAARTKARIGMTRTGLVRGLGSEGAFGADPFAGLMPWNVEILVLVDDVRGIEIVGMAQGPAMHAHWAVSDWPTAAAFAREARFPEHHLVVRADDQHDPAYEKGIDAREALEAAFLRAQARSTAGRVFLESDLRAHANPTRMAMIGRAAEDLAARYRSRRPRCASPGYSVVERQAGLPCSRAVRRRANCTPKYSGVRNARTPSAVYERICRMPTPAVVTSATPECRCMDPVRVKSALNAK